MRRRLARRRGLEQIRVSILQVEARRSKEEARRAIERLAERSSGDLLLLPEYAMFDPTGMSREEVLRGSESLDGEWVATLRRIARSRGSCIVGTLFEQPRTGDKPYNSVVAIDRDGSIVYTYRKTHLFDALGYKESSVFQRGDEPPRPFRLCGVRLGIAICFEIRYPEIFRVQAVEGAEAFVVPSGWYRGPGKEEAYEFLAQARAHENTVYLVGAVLAGERFTGRSLVVDPYGIVRARAGWREEILEYDLDPRVLDDARRDLPLLQLRRTDLYSVEYRRKNGGYSSTGTIS